MKNANRKGVPALIPFLVLVSVIFIGILIFAYFETKHLNPQMIEVGCNTPPTRSAALPV